MPGEIRDDLPHIWGTDSIEGPRQTAHDARQTIRSRQDDRQARPQHTTAAGIQ